MGTAILHSPTPAAATLRTGFATRIASILRTWVQRMQQRQALRAMSTYELRDIGLTPADAMREADKAPWRA